MKTNVRHHLRRTKRGIINVARHQRQHNYRITYVALKGTNWATSGMTADVYAQNIPIALKKIKKHMGVSSSAIYKVEKTQ